MLKFIKRFLHIDQAASAPSVDYKKQGNDYLAAGNLAAAAKCYRQAIDAHPKDSDAYVNLGFVLIEQSQYEAAVPYLDIALNNKPNDADVNYLLGIIAQHQHQTDKAIDYFYKAIGNNPSFEPAYQHLLPLLSQTNQIEKAEEVLIIGIEKNPPSSGLHYLLGEFYAEQQKLEGAVNHYRQALQLQPEYADAYNNLGIALQLLHKTDEATECFLKAIDIDPKNEKFYFNLGNVFKSEKNYPQAANFFQKAINCNINFDQAYHSLGVVLQELGEFESALKNYQMALAINPNVAEVEYCMGNLFYLIGNLAAAIEHYQRAISLKSDYSDAYNNLGRVFSQQGKLVLAIEQYDKAIFYNNNYVDAYNNVGMALRQLNKFEKAIECYRKAISINPDFGEAHNNLGETLKAQGYYAEAFACFKTALSIMPDSMFVRGNLLALQSVDLQCDPDIYLRDLKAYGDCVIRQAHAFHDWGVSLTTRDNKPLRVGLVSGDLRKHSVGYFLENVVNHIDTQRVQLMAYCTLPQEDEITQHIKSHCLLWRDISYLSNEKAAKLIRDDQVDLLIDLAGHTGHNRVALFGWRPAPVQITWLGYWASTGVPTIDYVLADELSLPLSHQKQFLEKVWYLPNTRMCFSSPSEAVKVAPPPAISNGYVTFGSFQNMDKINDAVLTLWGRILGILPTAQLRVQNQQANDESMRVALKSRLSKMGIPLERVIIKGSVPRRDYLEAHSEVDIILDTFPFSGGTTTCEALWMGVPTITLAGYAMIARQGASMLTSAGLSDWVAQSEDQYIAITLNKASDIHGLAQLRARLRSQVQASPLFNAELFARNLENALHGMWEEKRLMLVSERG